MSKKPKFMTHERIMAGEEYVSYSDYLLLQRERDEARAERDILRLNSLGTIQLNIPVTTDWRKEIK